MAVPKRKPHKNTKYLTYQLIINTKPRLLDLNTYSSILTKIILNKRQIQITNAYSFFLLNTILMYTPIQSNIKTSNITWLEPKELLYLSPLAAFIKRHGVDLVGLLAMQICMWIWALFIPKQLKIWLGY